LGRLAELLHHSVEAPPVRDALQLVLACIFEHEARARDEVLHRARHEDLTPTGERG